MYTPSRVQAEWGWSIVHHNRVSVKSASVWARRARRPFVMLRFRVRLGCLSWIKYMLYVYSRIGTRGPKHGPVHCHDNFFDLVIVLANCCSCLELHCLRAAK
jgi:hypothetical protein